MNKEKIKSIVYLFGKSIGVLGVLFVFYKLSTEYTLNTFLEDCYDLLVIIPVLLLLNILGVLVGIYAWHIMILNYAQKPFLYITSYYYFAKTEVAKYLPGNVFHFVGRQALASKIGITQKEMAKTSILFSFLLMTGTLFSSTIFALFSTETPLYIELLMSLASIIVIIVIIFLFPSFPLYRKVQMNLILALSVAMQGLMLGTIMLYQNKEMGLGLFFLFISIYIVSWLIGFITPGASGGLGVREGAFISISMFLQIDMSEDIIIFSVLMVRLINIIIDVLMYLSTYTLENRIKGKNF